MLLLKQFLYNISIQPPAQEPMERGQVPHKYKMAENHGVVPYHPLIQFGMVQIIAAAGAARARVTKRKVAYAVVQMAPTVQHTQRCLITMTTDGAVVRQERKVIYKPHL